jgi:hypothetical protein
MVGVPQGAMRVASQIWQVVLASQTLQVFYFGPLQKGTICSSASYYHQSTLPMLPTIKALASC